MARLDEDEVRAVECLDRLKRFLERYGRRTGAAFFVARGKDDGGHHLRVNLIPATPRRAAGADVTGLPSRSGDDLADLIVEFQMLSNMVGAQHREILDLIDVLSDVDERGAKSAPPSHLRLVETDTPTSGE
jgi:hypothetical protein